MFLKLSPKFAILISLLVILGCAPSLERFSTSYHKFLSYYDNLLEKEDVDPDLRVKFAQTCYSLKEYQRVKEILEGQEDLPAKVILAKTYTQLKEYDYALEVFNQIKDELQDPEALYLYGTVLEEKNLYPQAIKIYQRVDPPFQERAKGRIDKIKIAIERKIPPYILQLLKESVSFLQRIEDEAAVILLVEETVEIKPNNTSVSILHVVEKVLQERGKKSAEVEIGYDSSYERVELVFARTLTEDGRIIYAGRQNIRDVTKYLNYPLYSNAKAYIISMPSVDVGAIIEYKIKVYSSKLVNEDDFTILYRLREKYPIYEAKFDLILPKDREARFKFFNQDYALGLDLSPKIREEESKKIYSWRFNQILSIIPEESMPPYSYVNPAILITSFNSWEEIYRWWDVLYRDKLQLGDEAKNLVKELTQGLKDDYAKAKRIYEYVAKNIRYVAVEYGESGHEPHHAQEVFLNRYGDCKDQAILLIAMLRVAGIAAYPVLIPTQEAYPIEKNFPSINFNHAIAVVKLGDTFIFMDPTSTTTSFGDLPLDDQDREVLIFLDKTYKITKTPQLKDNRVTYLTQIEIDEEENAFIKREVSAQGAYASAQRWYLKYTHPNRIRENIENKITRICPFAELIEYKIEDVDDFDLSPRLEYTFSADKFLNPAKNLRIIPSLKDIDLSHSLIAKEKREFPLDLGGLFIKRSLVTIKLPQNLRVKYLPDDTKVETEWFGFKLSYKAEKETLEISQEFVIKKRIVEKDEYQNFRGKLKHIFHLLRERVILEKLPM
jgi:transglutaminase-like putative cysteine protease